MKEDLLHYIWLLQKFDKTNLRTESNEALSVISQGVLNINSGPDFFNSKIEIDAITWAGNVEIHVKASDWYLHKHENDKAYDNVILHVVWDFDISIFNSSNHEIPTLELKDKVDLGLLLHYKKLMSSKNWIPCEKEIQNIDVFLFNSFRNRLYFERLEYKSKHIEKLLKDTNNDWETVLYSLLLESFGLSINSQAFSEISKVLPLTALKKEIDEVIKIESLLFGQSGLLNESIEDSYYIELQEEYEYLKKKYNLIQSQITPVFFRLRPISFPTIRLSQFANLYATHHNLFSRIIESSTLDDLYLIFQIKPSQFWETHYTFQKVSNKSIKKVSKGFIDLLLINVIIPIKYSYSRYIGNPKIEELIDLIQKMKPERNSIVDKFETLKIKSDSAFDTQSILELKKSYCDKKKCLQCVVGNKLLGDN